MNMKVKNLSQMFNFVQNCSWTFKTIQQRLEIFEHSILFIFVNKCSVLFLIVHERSKNKLCFEFGINELLTNLVKKLCYFISVKNEAFNRKTLKSCSNLWTKSAVF